MEPNEEAYAYDKRRRTEVKSAKRPAGKKPDGRESAVKTDRDQARVRQRSRKLSREELVDRLLLANTSMPISSASTIMC